MIHHLQETMLTNWLLLLAPFLWIVGLAIFTALMGLAIYLLPGRSQWTTRFAFFKKPLVTVCWSVAFFLIIAGPILYSFKLDSPDLIVVKIKKPRPNTSFLAIPIAHTFTTRELKMDPQNGAHPQNKKSMETGPMFLFWDGYVRTPFLALTRGNYMVTFQAAGSFAQDAFSKIKVEFQTPDAKYYLITPKRLYLELGEKRRVYSMTFQTPVDGIGRIGITFFNDIYLPESRQGRDVWLDDLSIYAIRN